MTTAYTSTTSSQGTQKTLSLVEAPFWKYLEILRKEGYTSDADTSELFYVEMLTGFDYTKEQVMNTSFENLVKAVEALIEQANTEITTSINPISVSGPLMVGKGAEGLNEGQLNYLTRRQMQLHEEEKMRKNP